MTDSLNIISNLFQSLSVCLFLFSYFKSKYSIKVKKIQLGFCIVVLFLSYLLSSLFISSIFLKILINFIVVFLFSIILLKGTLIAKFTLSLLPIVFLSVIDLITQNFNSSITLISTNEYSYYFALENVGYNFTIQFAIQAMYFYVLVLIIVFSQKEKYNLKRSEWIFITTILLISVVILLSLSIIGDLLVGSYEQNWILVCILCLVIINFVTYYLVIGLSQKNAKILENSLLKQQYTMQTKASRTLKMQYEELQKMRHDFKHSLSVIQALGYEGKSEQIVDYVNKYVEQQTPSLKLIATNNDYVNDVINSKLSHAFENKIATKFEATFDIEAINEIDLCNLLSNLFDNAIESCLKCDDKRNIYFELSKIKNGITFFIKNSIPSSVITDNPNLKTSKENKDIHGFGTKIIKDIVEKHSGIYDIYEENDYFCCNIILYSQNKD